jgi:hypothetical protein
MTAPPTLGAAVRFIAPPTEERKATQAGPDVFAAGGIDKECGQVEFRVTALDRSDAIELVPLYSECTTKALNGLPTKMVWWGCGYLLHPMPKAGREETWKANVDFVCPEELEIEWNVYESTGHYHEAKTVCVTKMPPQRVGGFAELSNLKSSPGEILVRWKLKDIVYETFGSGLFCGLTPGRSKNDATYTGSAVIGPDLTVVE